MGRGKIVTLQWKLCEEANVNKTAVAIEENLLNDEETVTSEVRGLHYRQELFASKSFTTFCSPNKGLSFDCISSLPSVTRHPPLEAVWPPFQKGRHLAPQNLSHPRAIG